jgi:CO/xanthine dehydrogenase FAD-binding subunit
LYPCAQNRGPSLQVNFELSFFAFSFEFLANNDMGILRKFQYHRPETLKEALNLFDKKGSMLMAGGTIVLDILKKARRVPENIIGLKGVCEVKGIKNSSGELTIGAMATIDEVLQEPFVRKNVFSLFQAVQSLGTTPIRNMATVGGNLASRFFWADLPAVLMSLDASINFVTSKGDGHLKVDEFLKMKPSEKMIIKKVVIPAANSTTRYFRHTRDAMAVGVPYVAMASACLKKGQKIEDARLIVNAACSFPFRLGAVESYLNDRGFAETNPKDLKHLLSEDLAKRKIEDHQKSLLLADLMELIPC